MQHRRRQSIFQGRQARFQCPPSQTRTTRQTGAGRIRPLNTAFAMPVGMPQILFPIKPPAPNAGRFHVYSERKGKLIIFIRRCGLPAESRKPRASAHAV